MTVVRKDLTRAQADELIRNIRLEDPNAELELIDQGNGLWTVRIESSAPTATPDPASGIGGGAARPSEPGRVPPIPAQPMPAGEAESPWLAIARSQEGVREMPGAGSNPIVEGYFACTTGGPRPDDVPWCGAFVSFCLARAGVIEKGSARAADWLDWGTGLEAPKPGCVAVLRPQSPGASGHVGFWVDERDGEIFLLGGNQGNEVKVSRYPVAEVRSYRWPT